MRPIIMNCNDSSGQGKDIYIYDLPHSVQQELCEHLDALNVWTQLGTYMKLYPAEMQLIKNHHSRGNSPSKELLKIWGAQYNHSVLELYIVLNRHKLYQAMRLIKDYVERKYHTLIPNSLPAISRLRAPPSINVNNTSRKLLNCSLHSSSGVSNSNNVDTNDSNSDSYSTNDSRNANNHGDLETRSAQQTINLTESSVLEYASSILEINYNELSEATNSWSDTHILGQGGFGVVYRGYWKHTDVAIKLMRYRSSNGDENVKVQIQQSLNELKHLNSCRHDNVLPLYGYSIKGEKPCLVYQLMKGGSLEQRLSGKKHEPLTWQQRFNICLGTARGINFLHTSRATPLIHGDIKPGNILLDQCLHPKIGDFGLAREGPKAINSAVRVHQVFGTKFYLPPEFIHSKKLSTQVDTYSFGVVLLETFTGMRAYDKNRTEPLPSSIQQFCANAANKLESILDPRQSTPTVGPELEMCCSIVQLALRCTAVSPQHRPEMEGVLKSIDSYYTPTY